jgi:hypothetical protein
MIVGGLVGVEYALVITVGELLLNPASAGGTGSVGLSVFGAVVGLVIGLGNGFGVGVVTCGALAAVWAIGVPQRIAALVGSIVVVATAVALVLAVTGPDPASLLIPLCGSTQGIAGVILLTWVAGLRPHDYRDIFEEHSTMSV